jgi:hypothetical protein
MATWRRRALETFPELRRTLNDSELTLYGFFPQLVGRVWEAHDADEEDMLRRIYGYTSWAARHPAKELWNPAGVSFYEHLFLARKDQTDWPKSLAYIAPDIVRDVWGLWEWFLTEHELEAIRKMLADLGRRNDAPPREQPVTAVPGRNRKPVRKKANSHRDPRRHT